MASTMATADDGRPEPARTARDWTMVAVLTLAAAMAGMDRQLPTILQESIRRELGLIDTQLGLITGLSFVLAMSIMALPMGVLADKKHRGRLITAGVVFWCAMTVACGFAQDFWSLLIFRMGVGVGEAVLMPCAYSLIADVFGPQSRAKAFALLALGSTTGNALAYLGGGPLHDLFVAGQLDPVFGLAPWRSVFVVVGAVGMVVAGLTLLFVYEPRNSRNRPRNGSAISAAGVLTYISGGRAYFVPIMVGIVFYYMFIGGYNAWTAPFLIRTYGWTTAQTGSAMGTAGLLTSLVGAPLGAFLVLSISRRRGGDGTVLALATAAALTIPLVVAAPLMTNGWAAFGFAATKSLMVSATMAIAPAAILNAVPPQFRARSAGLFVFMVNLAGLGTGATVYGMFTDFVLQDPMLLRYSLAIVSPVLLTISVIAYLYAQRCYDDATKRSATTT